MKKYIPHIALLNEQQGQSMIILAFSFIGLIAMMGLGLDLGLVYIEKTAMKRAIDAAALSAVDELPNEEEAALRAIAYLDANGYHIGTPGDPDGEDNLANSNVYFKGCVQDIHDYYSDTGTWCGSPGCGGGNREQIVDSEEFYPYIIFAQDDADAENVFFINTYDFDSTHSCNGTVGSNPSLGDANKIMITGTNRVDMNFMGLLGRPAVDVTDHAVAQNVDSIDAVVVLDRSGSMEFDPVCYGCWERKDRLDVTDPDYNANPGADYPANGVIYALGWDSGSSPEDHFADEDRVKACTTLYHDADQYLPGGPQNIYNFNVSDTVYTGNGARNIIIEAEMYSLNPAPVVEGLQEQGKGYWAMQRGEGNYSSECSSGQLDGTPPCKPNFESQGTSIDGKGAHMAHHPSVTEYDGTVYGHFYTLQEAQNGNAPWLEYDFKFYSGAGWTGGSAAHIWVRVHANRGVDYNYDNIAVSGYPNFTGSDAQNVAYWGLVEAAAPNTPIPADVLPNPADVQRATDVNRRAINDNYSNNWHWVYLGSINHINLDTYYRLYFYAGSAGYSIDRIIITDNNSANGNTSDQRGDALGDARTAPATVSSAYRSACDFCNPLYAANITDPVNQCTIHAAGESALHDGSYPDAPDFWLGVTVAVNNALSPIFDEWENPLRASKEAIKGFMLNDQIKPKRDQVGFVYYSSEGQVKTQLACKRAKQKQGVPCDPDDNSAAFSDVLNAVEMVRATGGTPTAYGMREGLEVLGLNGNNTIDMDCDGTYNSSCSRGGGAQRVMILMTDGMPNSTNWGNGCTDATAPPWSVNSNDYRCPLYYAQQAARNGITVYVIGIGFGLDTAYLKKIAEYGNGKAYVNVSPGDLDRVFAEILSNIYIRLIE